MIATYFSPLMRNTTGADEMTPGVYQLVVSAGVTAGFKVNLTLSCGMLPTLVEVQSLDRQ